MGDDIYFRNRADGRPLWDFLVWRYWEWSSRSIIEVFTVFMSQYHIIWRVCNVFCSVLIFYALKKLLGIKEKKAVWFLGLCITVYTYIDMASAGWIATTTNYWWVLAALLTALLPLRKYHEHERIHWWEWIAYTIATLYACNQEQTVIMFSILLFIFVLCCWSKKEFKIYGLYWQGIVALGSLLFILCCPGNQVRFQIEMSNSFPNFSELSIIDKVYLGILKWYNSFLAAGSALLFLLTIILVIVMIKKYQAINLKTLIACVPFALNSLHLLLPEFYPQYSKILCKHGTCYTVSYRSISTWIPVLCVFAFVASASITIWDIYKDMKTSAIFMLSVFGAGILSIVMMGFSPTIYASGNRTNVFMSFVLLFLANALMKKSGFLEKESIANKLFLGAVSILAVCSVLIPCAYLFKHLW